jgi:alpha-glucuronidase
MLFSQNLPLLPSPQQVVEREGFFNMNEFVPVFRRNNASIEEQRAIWMLCEGFENIFGKPLKITDKAKGSIIVLRNLSLEMPPKKEEKMILPVGEEGYQLNILPDKIEIIANSNAGLFYGSQTLLQLFRTSSLTGNINCMTINDMPSSSQRYLCYYWDSDRAPSFNYSKQLILCA